MRISKKDTMKSMSLLIDDINIFLVYGFISFLFLFLFLIESFNICTNHFTYNIKVYDIDLYLHNIDQKEVTFNIHYIFRST